MRNAILSFIDFFYPPFKRFISLHNFRYLATGGSAWLLGNIVFYVAFNYLFHTDDVSLFSIVIKRQTAALALDILIVIPYSFLLNRYVIFTHSEIKGHVQLFRFLNLNLINALANYVLLKFFIEALGIYPTISRVLISILIALFSYMYQHYFTFGVKKFRKKNEDKQPL